MDNMWHPRSSRHHRRKKQAKTPLVATEKLEDRTLLTGLDLIAFAQALTAADVKLYGAAWDADTTAQKSLFEDGAQFLQFEEVTDANRVLNANASIVGIDSLANLRPLWRLSDGTLIEGNQINSIQELSTELGIDIPVSEDPFLKEISDQNLLSGTALHVALDGFDPENGPLTYTVESSNSDVGARILSGNRSIRISVEGYGDMVFELFEGRASRATERIIFLAENNYYDQNENYDVEFHQIIDGLIRGGAVGENGPAGTNLGFFDDQFHAELQHVQSGLLTMYKQTGKPGDITDPNNIILGETHDDENDAQFMITDGPKRINDFQNTIFGYLIEGEEVREAISNIAVSDDIPNYTVTIETIDVFTDSENATLVLTAPEGYTGSSTITVTVQDQDGNTQQRQFEVNVTPDLITDDTKPENANPFLADIPDIQVSPGSSVEYQLEAIDIDLGAPNGNLAEDFVYFDQSRLQQSALAIPAPAQQGLFYNVNQFTGLLTVSPSVDLVPGIYEITVAVGINQTFPNGVAEEFLELQDYQVITVRVGDPPVANDDFFALQGATPGPINILSNDTDSDGTLDLTSVEIVDQPAHGTITTNADGTVNYIADGSGFMGLGSFTYRVYDNLGISSNIATVDFSIAPTGVILVTTLNDQTTADGKVSLREAIEAANSDNAFDVAPAGNGHDTIMFDPALFIDEGSGSTRTIDLAGRFLITDSLTIIAPTSPEGDALLTLDADNPGLPFRHFLIDDGISENTLIVSLQNLKLINAQTNGNGGSIFNSEHLVITNSELINNQTDTGLGGAIYNTGTLEISNSLLQSNNSQFSNGGAIASQFGSVTLYQTTLDDNRAEGNGGGIHASDADITITDSLVSNNTGFAGEGGGLYQLNGQLNITNSTFLSNSSQGPLNGGGISASQTTTIITGSTFHDNQSILSGGGLYQLDGSLSIRDSTFSENIATNGDGGAIHAGMRTEVSILNSTISGNEAGQDGGGIYLVDTSGIDIQNEELPDRVIDHSTVADNTAGNQGGGLHVSFGEVRVNHTIIADNSASNGGDDAWGLQGTITGSYSLVENTAVVSISGTNFITGLDPGLLPLAENGGLTKTHALSTGSVAIDAGDPAFDPNTFTPALTLDQRNSARVADGNNDSISRVDIGAYEAESVLGSAELTVKRAATNVGSSGQVGSLPSNVDFIDEWNPVIVEIWVSVTNSSENGVTAASVDLSFDAQYLIANSIEYGPEFTGNQTGNIDNDAGMITGLGASTTQTDHGAESRVLLARVHLSVKPIPLNADGQYIQPVANLNFEISNSDLSSSLGDVSVTEGAAVNLTLVPALYDLNDNGSIDFKDLILFASVYNTSTGDPGAPGAWAADFNRSGRVDFRDLILFASNYNKTQGSGHFFAYPSNFDEVWQQNNLITSIINPVEPNLETLTSEKVEPVLDAAQEQLDGVYGDIVNEELADVEVQIVELPGNQLAKADTATNIIYLDVNAAGWGWFVDQTPLSNEEFNGTSVPGIFEASLFSSANGKIDLLTVLMHELNHLLGHKHDHEDSLMEPDLAPGERKLSLNESQDFTETDEYFGRYLDPEFESI
ncbi:Putative peptidyl-prolyl cis-trans isomerase [Gimesia aquarii]|uniref:Peptidyl-prolyl cis-trans isomerase n=2 Tax=Gimesia aquarii TaxID=2527964 RepID=A0A517VTI6_9PLAN|nr:Putative peptidyl-prolyl cis-trans isomerase [Gimesia aquarii]